MNNKSIKVSSDGYVLLLSLQPRYAELIFNETKKAELRRIRPRVDRGDFLFIYVCSPEKVLLGSCEVKEVMQSSPNNLWKLVNKDSGLKKAEFLEYFDGVSTGYAIFVQNVQKFNQPIKLSRLQQEWDGFHPPQSYRYLTIEEVDSIGIMAEHDMTNISMRLQPKSKQVELNIYQMSSSK
ncbi:ASCH domain-containing protein [Pseudanabaena biceps]|nr:ASCH domain-containing protein [Pseudanabaena biceps]